VQARQSSLRLKWLARFARWDNRIDQRPDVNE
jgi:hypothetical protein